MKFNELMRILIAEDEPVSRRVLETHLTKWGYEVVVTQNGREAWMRLQQPDAPKLAILDWMMPEMDGVEVVRRLRASEGSSYIYVLLLTAKGQKEDLVAGLGSGADDYVTKPFDALELRARIHTGIRILGLQDQLIAAREALREEATHDHLTKVWNRAGILDILRRECSRAQRARGSVGLVMADLDHFKLVNDTYGHLVGDKVLGEVTRRMEASVRAYDSVGRFGGEEFVIVLPECEALDALRHAGRLQSAVSESPVSAGNVSVPVTLSLGVAASREIDCWNYEALLRAADAALYRAKMEGRNRAVLAEPKEVIVAGPCAP